MARKAAELTREQLAKRIGVAADAIEEIEKAGFESDIVTLFRRIARALRARNVISLEFVP